MTQSVPETMLTLNFLIELLDYSSDEIYIVDREMKIVFVNRASERHYGLPKHEVIGEQSDELFQRGLWKPSIIPLVLEEKQEVSLRQQTAIGTELLTRAFPIEDETGELEHPCKVMILTTFARAGYFERARKAGVRGYLLKDSPIEELVDAIRAVVAGRRMYAPELIDIAYDEIIENPLTDRESEVLRLVAEGKTTKEIAGELFLAPGTVRNYISTILDKLDVGNRIEAIARFKEKGWFR